MGTWTVAACDFARQRLARSSRPRVSPAARPSGLLIKVSICARGTEGSLCMRGTGTAPVAFQGGGGESSETAVRLAPTPPLHSALFPWPPSLHHAS